MTTFRIPQTLKRLAQRFPGNRFSAPAHDQKTLVELLAKCTRLEATAKPMIVKYLQRIDARGLDTIAGSTKDHFLLQEIANHPAAARNTLRYLSMKGYMHAYERIESSLSHGELYGLFLSVDKGSEVRKAALVVLLAHQESTPQLIAQIITGEIVPSFTSKDQAKLLSLLNKVPQIKRAAVTAQLPPQLRNLAG